MFLSQMKQDIFEGSLTGKKFANFVWPSVLMMVVLSLYYTIDAIFVANFVGEEGLAAINIAYPFQGILWGFAVMLAAGSSALVGIEMGQGKGTKADEDFTFVCVFGVILGLLWTVLGLVFLDPIVSFLGATEVLTEDCHIFLSVFVWGCPVAFLGVLYEFFIRVDGHPAFTIALYVAGGIVHLGLDILLMGPLNMGLKGAAIANISGLAATAFMGLAYFLLKDTRLNYRKFTCDWKYIGHSFVNGSPELINESAGGIMVFFYNIILIGMAGETGVAAGAIVLQINYLILSVHIGYQVGCMPLISYFYGAARFEKINRIMRYTAWYIAIASVLATVVCIVFAPQITSVYTDRGTELFDMSVYGLRVSSLSLLAAGINIFASGFFTCYGNGLVSSIISISSGIVMLLVGLFTLPHFFGITGAWLALVFAQFTTLTLSFAMMRKYRGRYHYKIFG